MDDISAYYPYAQTPEEVKKFRLWVAENSARSAQALGWPKEAAPTFEDPSLKRVWELTWVLEDIKSKEAEKRFKRNLRRRAKRAAARRGA